MFGVSYTTYINRFYSKWCVQINSLVLTLVMLINIITPSSAQNKITPASNNLANHVFIPNTNATHPFGVYIGRIQHHQLFTFQNKNSWLLHVSSGNVWLPETIGNIPSNIADRNAVAAFEWHERDGYFDFSNTPSQTIKLQADGVFRLYQPQFIGHIGTKHNVIFSSRIISIDAGRFPFSTITNDKFIEWVHTNIAGGEDPFARKVNGLNNDAYFEYSDRNNKTANLKSGQVQLTGFDITDYFYVKSQFFNSKQIDVRTGVHLGINLNKINPGVDLGSSIAARWWKNTSKGNQNQLSLSYGLLRQKLIAFSSGVEIANRNFMHNIELLYSLVIIQKPNQFYTISGLVFGQSGYLKQKEYNYLVLTGKKESPFWHYGISHLYRTSAGISFIVSHTRGKIAYSVYLREDIPLNNAPDTQTGISIKLDW